MRLVVVQIEMLLMICCGVLAVYVQEGGAADLSDAWLLLSGGWGTLGALAVPWEQQRAIPAAVEQSAE